MTRNVGIALLVGLAALLAPGCKSDTCADACGALRNVAKSPQTPETAERCMRECSAWPESLRTCVAESKDQQSVEVCLQKAYKLDSDRATQRAENAPPEGATEEPLPAAAAQPPAPPTPPTPPAEVPPAPPAEPPTAPAEAPAAPAETP